MANPSVANSAPIDPVNGNGDDVTRWNGWPLSSELSFLSEPMKRTVTKALPKERNLLAQYPNKTNGKNLALVFITYLFIATCGKLSTEFQTAHTWLTIALLSSILVNSFPIVRRKLKSDIIITV